MTDEAANPFEVALLGTGSPLPPPPPTVAPGATSSSRETRSVLVDCGWGAGRRVTYELEPTQTLRTMGPLKPERLRATLRPPQ